MDPDLRDTRSMPVRRGRWQAFAEAHGLEVFVHAHDSLLGAQGTSARQKIWLVERGEGGEFQAEVAQSLEFVVCDRQFLDWSRVSERVRVAEEGHALARRALGEEQEAMAVRAGMRPHLSVPAQPATGVQEFDARFLLLHGVIPIQVELLSALVALPECVQVWAYRGMLHVRLTGAVLNDDLFSVLLSIATKCEPRQ